jgi:hypothetical protein
MTPWLEIWRGREKEGQRDKSNLKAGAVTWDAERAQTRFISLLTHGIQYGLIILSRSISLLLTGGLVRDYEI